MTKNYNLDLQTNNTTLTTHNVSLQELIDQANALPDANSGGIDTSDATAEPVDIMVGKTAYVSNEKITGTFTIEEELTQQDSLISQLRTLLNDKAIPGAGIDTSDATATSADILNGKIAYANDKKIVGTIMSQEATTYTPSTNDQIIAAGLYCADDQIIKGDSNLIASNIKNGITIFNVTGTYEKPDGYIKPTGTINISASGTYNVTNYASAEVNLTKTEIWTITLEDGSTIEKTVVVDA